ncbi:MAG: hypothetical protein IJS15_17215 [Victivallales bacterium]|nr:hypothetical protein [Victivallales bacterium]
MASYITYTQGATFSYDSQTYQHSLNLQFTNYKLDKFGRKVSGGNDDLQVRSYYKVDGVDSAVNGMPLTVEDLVTLLAVKRANVLEREITPMAKIIDARNKRIEDLGTLLASVAQTQSKLESQEEGDDNSYACKGLGYYLKLYFTDSELGEANLLGWVNAHTSIDDNCSSKRSEGYIASANQLIKAKIDSLNNDAQSDLSRMDNLVSKRDEAYTLSTDLLSKFSDGRSAILNNMK